MVKPQLTWRTDRRRVDRLEAILSLLFLVLFLALLVEATLHGALAQVGLVLFFLLLAEEPHLVRRGEYGTDVSHLRQGRIVNRRSATGSTSHYVALCRVNGNGWRHLSTIYKVNCAGELNLNIIGMHPDTPCITL